mgnify:CR=1 FL=1
MKLKDYIVTHHNNSVSDFARANNYHLTQVQRHIEKGAYIEDGRVYFKKYLNKRGNNE